MGKWHAVKGKDHPYCGGERFWSVSEEDGSKLIFITRDEEIAKQIVREHNAHDALVKLAKDYRSTVMSYVRNDAVAMKAAHAIDAVLAQAEGRE